MAESVDALVSNTSGAIRAGSTPALGTINPLVSILVCKGFSFYKSSKCTIYEIRRR